jgi:hypothetical protein
LECDPRSDPEWADNQNPFRRERKNEPLKDSMEISLELEIFNNGSYPLTIKSITARVSNGARGKTCREFGIGSQTLLPPRKDGAENSYICQVPIALNADEVRKYYKTAFAFQVWIEVVVLDAEGTSQPQSFHRWAAGGLREFLIAKDDPERLTKKEKEQAD